MEGGGERRRDWCAVRHSRLLTSIRWQKGGDTIHNPHLCSLVIAGAHNCNTMLATALCLARCDAGEVQFAGYKKLSFFMLPCLYYKSRSTRTQWCFFPFPPFRADEPCAVFPSTINKCLLLLLDTCFPFSHQWLPREPTSEPPLWMSCGKHCTNVSIK